MIVMVSGGFDPVHRGHIRLFRAAAKYGQIIVALNSDEWLMRKKGYVVMPWIDRMDVLIDYRYIKSVVAFDDSDGTVCDAIRKYVPDYFANGGDRITADPKEHAVCVEHGIKELFGVGGGKVNSSSEIVKAIR